jgi:O-antigen ligase
MAVAGLSVMLLGITHVRILWGGFILMGVILGWLRSVRVAATAVAIAILITFGLGLVNFDIKEQVVSLGNIENYVNMGTGTIRREQWRKGLAMWRDAPWLGIGPRGFNLHDDPDHNPQRAKYGPTQGHPHNMWIYSAVEIGAVGTLILAATFAYLGFWLFRWRSRFPSSWAAAVWDGAFGSWLSILVAGVTEPSFGAENAMLFMMLVGALRQGVGGGQGNHPVVAGAPGPKASCQTGVESQHEPN